MPVLLHPTNTGLTNRHFHVVPPDLESGVTSTDEGHAHPFKIGDALTGTGGDDSHTHVMPV